MSVTVDQIRNARMDSRRHFLQTHKVKESRYSNVLCGWLPDIAADVGKVVDLNLSQVLSWCYL